MDVQVGSSGIGKGNSSVLVKLTAPVVQLRTIIDRIITMERMRRIARFLGISIKDIKYMTPAGGDPNLVGHFVAVDRRSKAVVLAIRGTYSVSDVVTDLDAETGVFWTCVCEGARHRNGLYSLYP